MFCRENVSVILLQNFALPVCHVRLLLKERQNYHCNAQHCTATCVLNREKNFVYHPALTAAAAAVAAAAVVVLQLLKVLQLPTSHLASVLSCCNLHLLLFSTVRFQGI
jgi:hypothetical protein